MVVCIAAATTLDGFFNMDTGAVQVWESHPGVASLLAQRFAQFMVGDWVHLAGGKRGVMARHSQDRTDRFTAWDLDILRAHGIDL